MRIIHYSLWNFLLPTRWKPNRIHYGRLFTMGSIHFGRFDCSYFLISFSFSFFRLLQLLLESFVLTVRYQCMPMREPGEEKALPTLSKNPLPLFFFSTSKWFSFSTRLITSRIGWRGQMLVRTFIDDAHQEKGFCSIPNSHFLIADPGLLLYQ